MKINPIGEKVLVNILKPKGGQGANNAFTDFIDSAQSSQKESDQLLQKMVSGQEVEPHEVMLSLRKAEINFQLVLELRNKMLGAYQQIMKEQF